MRLDKNTKLVHELQTYQTELLSQNDELRKTQEELEISRSKYFELYDLAPVGYLSINDKGIILEANLTASALLGVEKISLLKRPFSQFITEEFQDTYYKYYRQLLNTGEIQTCELKLLKKKDEIFWGYLKVTLDKETSFCNILLLDITERKKIEEDFIISETRYRRLFETAKDGIIILDAVTGMIVDVNPFLINMLGYTKEQFLGKAIWDIGIFKNILKNKENFIELQQKEYIRYEDLPLETFDGKYIEVEFVSNVYLVNSHKVIQCNIRNITDRVIIEKLLRESEEKFSLAFKTSPYSITITDAKGLLIEANDAFYEMSGYIKGEEGSSLDLWNNPEDRKNIVKELFETGKVARREFNFRKKNGEILIGMFSAHLMHIKDEVNILSSINDVTESRKTEERLREILENSTDSAYKRNLLTDSYEYMSPVFFKITGYTPEEMKTIPIEELKKTLHPDDSDTIEKGILDSLINTDRNNNQMEYRFKHKNGSWLWFQDRYTIMRDASNQPVAIIGNVTDITEAKRLAEERFELERELLHMQKLKSLGIMAGGIAHDFNNLLTSIGINIELAKREYNETIEFLDIASEAVKKATHLSHQMLAYSGKGKYTVSSLNLSKLVEENVHIFRASIPATTEINLNLSQDIPTILGDDSQIQQVIMNLITNASEAIGSDIGAITITTGIKNYSEEGLSVSRINKKPLSGDFVYVEISDTGCGMNKDTVQKIFDPFFTTKFTGRGLGMSALKGIVEGHRGAVFINSVVGKGTTIQVAIPVVENISDEEGSIKDMEVIYPLSHGTILIADDEEFMRNLCNKLISEMGYTVITAKNGLEAVELFKNNQEHIVCVILDLTMPKMDGYTAFNEIKKINPDARVILSSGFNEQVVVQSLVGADLAGFLQKPYTIKELQNQIRKAVYEG